MLRIGVVSAAMILACLGPVAHTFGDRFERRRDFGIAGRGQAARWPAGPEQSAEAYPSSHREIVWRPESTGSNPFGFIPTQWTARPQLLPLTWEMRTVFASNGVADAKVLRR